LIESHLQLLEKTAGIIVVRIPIVNLLAKLPVMRSNERVCTGMETTGDIAGLAWQRLS
jgi:hypothetical protein